MAKHIWTVLCKTKIVDAATNALSLIQVLEELSVLPEQPVLEDWVLIPVSAALVVFVERSNLTVPEQCQLKLEVVAPNGQVHPQPIEWQIDLTQHKRTRVSIQLGVLPFRGLGANTFAVSLRQTADDNWTRVSETPLEFNLMDNTVPAPASARKAPVKKTPRKKRAAS